MLSFLRCKLAVFEFVRIGGFVGVAGVGVGRLSGLVVVIMGMGFGVRMVIAA